MRNRKSLLNIMTVDFVNDYFFMPRSFFRKARRQMHENYSTPIMLLSPISKDNGYKFIISSLSDGRVRGMRYHEPVPV
jgi:hypothetical protein